MDFAQLTPHMAATMGCEPSFLQATIRKIRWERQPARKIRVALAALADDFDADGATLVNAPGIEVTSPPNGGVLRFASARLLEANDDCLTGTTADGFEVLVARLEDEREPALGLVFWRFPGRAPWTANDCTRASWAGDFAELLLDFEATMSKVVRQSRNDALTGLLNRNAFHEDLGPRLERLDHEKLPGSLILIEVDNLEQFSSAHGEATTKDMLGTLAGLLRITVRPSDLVARLEESRFAIWMDGVDTLLASKRAEYLRSAAPRIVLDVSEDGSQVMSLSIGIATRRPSGDDDRDDVLSRAVGALEEDKRNSG